MSGYDVGRVTTVKLGRPIQLNGKSITTARIEIDHINFGINSKTGGLNRKPRSKFSVKDIEKFIMLLDKEDLVPNRKQGTVSHFDLRVNCPIAREFHLEQFFMFFDLNAKNSGEITVVTIFRVRR